MTRLIQLGIILITLVTNFGCNEKEAAIEIDLSKSPNQIELFSPNIISTHLYERDMAISPSGNEIIYTLSDQKQLKRCLVSIKRNGSKWGRPKIVGFSGIHHDIEPFFDPNGERLFFASNRPIYGDSTRSDFNIWVSERQDNDWADPIALGENINTTAHEFYPAIASNGNLYFTAQREDGIGSEDIFLGRFINDRYEDPIALDTNINSRTYEFNAYVSPDERIIIFSSFGREDDMGGGDLYISKKNDDGSWQNAWHLGDQINSSFLDYCPFIDWPRNNFYFTSEQYDMDDRPIQAIEDIIDNAESTTNGYGNIYRIRLDKILKN